MTPRLTMVMNKEHHSGLERLAAHVADGWVASPTDRPFTPADAPEAVWHFVAGKAVGKAVITVWPVRAAGRRSRSLCPWRWSLLRARA